jgi:hypothetical protein
MSPTRVCPANESAPLQIGGGNQHEHGLKNQSVFMKTGPDRFHWGEFKHFKKSKKIKIKNSKKTRADFKIFGPNRIQKFEVTHPTKFGERETEEKPRKKEMTGSL